MHLSCTRTYLCICHTFPTQTGDPVAASSSTTGLAPNVVGLTSPIVRLENRHFPNFYVENLQSGTAFGMVVYAQNSKVSPFPS